MTTNLDDVPFLLHLNIAVTACSHQVFPCDDAVGYVISMLGIRCGDRWWKREKQRSKVEKQRRKMKNMSRITT